MRRWAGVGTGVVLMGVAALVAQGRTVADGVYAAEQAARGAGAYERACASCHLSDLRGESFAPALSGDTFARRWRGGKLADLQTIVAVTMPADSPGSLSPADSTDIVAFLLQANGYPAGSALGPAPEDSAGILFPK